MINDIDELAKIFAKAYSEESDRLDPDFHCSENYWICVEAGLNAVMAAAGVGTVRTHRLKCLTEFFDVKAKGLKPFEIRKNDRDYKVGDILELHEWTGKEYTGSVVREEVTYITDYMQRPGYVVMATKVILFGY